MGVVTAKLSAKITDEALAMKPEKTQIYDGDDREKRRSGLLL